MMIKSLLIVFALLSGSFSAVGADMMFPIVINKKVKNVVTVAKAKGDFTDPVAAVNSITDAAAGNEYLVVIAPGTYTLAEKLVMKSHVHLTGSGVGSTKLIGALGGSDIPTSAIIEGASNSTISSMEIWNLGGGNYSTGIYISGIVFLTLENIKIVVLSESGTNSGVYIYGGSSMTFKDSSITATGGRYAYGINNEYGTVKVDHCEILASSASNVNRSVYTHGVNASTTIRYSKIQTGVGSVGASSLYSRDAGALNDVKFSEVNTCSDTYNVDSDNKCAMTITTDGIEVSSSCLSDGLCA